MIATLKSPYNIVVIFLLFLTGGFYAIPLTAEDAAPEKCFERAVSLTPPPSNGQQQPLTIKAELALTDEQRKQGLMNRHQLDEDAGMMFFWPEPRKIFMWMKNTYIPLDMIFIKGQKIVGIVEATKTQNTTPLTVPALADKILEVNHGVTKAHGVAKGWRVDVGTCVE